MKIGIVGLGLIGGSILKSLVNKGFEVCAVTRNKKTQDIVKTLCVAVSEDYEILSGCEVVFVCVPMSNVLETLDKLERILPESTIVTDISSLKNFVMNKKYNYKFIGSHPMAGTEHAGYENSFETLFEGAKWVVTPRPETNGADIKKLENVIMQTGANVVYADAKEHDEAVAKISHMPMLLAQALLSSVKDDELALELAASGFRDMTRLAMSNVEMACDMVNLNGKNIALSLENLQSAILDLKNNYEEKIQKIREIRSKMYDKNGKNVTKF